MDSRLLNAFHDDPFDGNFTNYNGGPEREFWSNEGETMIFNTETFDDVLPINPMIEPPNFYEEIQTNTGQLNRNINLEKSNRHRFINQNYTGHQENVQIEKIDLESTTLQTDGEVGLEDDLERKLRRMHYGFETEQVNYEEESDNEDRLSHYSIETFRTRTDSSSIGDYESHSSDYDEDDFHIEEVEAKNLDDSEVLENFNNNHSAANPEDAYLLNDLPTGLMENDDDILTNFGCSIESIIGNCTENVKKRTISTNTLGSDVDGFSLNIDANNFDLAEFITKDDFILESTKAKAVNVEETLKTFNETKLIQIPSDTESDSDSESDIIVDVENLEIDEEMELKQTLLAAASLQMQNENQKDYDDDLKYNDNPIGDPSWSPNVLKNSDCFVAGKDLSKNKSTSSIAKTCSSNTINHNNSHISSNSNNQSTNRNYPKLVPNKKQCDILKKFGSGRGGKNLLAQRNAKIAAKKAQDLQKTSQSTEIEGKACPKKPNPTQVVQAPPCLGKGLRGKNLALLKQEEVVLSEHSSEENVSPLKTIIKIEEPILSPIIEEKLPQETSQIVAPQSPPVEFVNTDTPSLEEPPQEIIKPPAVKRKLNLEEYKMMRRGELVLPLDNKIQKPSLTTTINSNKAPNLPHENQAKSSQVPVISTQSSKPSLSPSPSKKSSEAVKTIVQTLKTPQESSEVLDPIIQARNKVLRMQELKKAQQIKIIDSTVSKKVPRVTKLLPLREIVKDIFPLQDDDSLNCHKKDPNYEEIITFSAGCNTDISIPPKKIFESVRHPRSILKTSAQINLTTQCLLASIQNEVVKKTQEKNLNNHSRNVGQTADYQGENKVIMHLRKDRIPQKTSNASSQTELTPEFPLLPLPKAVLEHKSRERHRHKKRHYRRKRSLSSESAHSLKSSSSFRSRSRSGGRSRSQASETSSVEGLRQTDSLAGGYSSRSSRRHRSSLSSSSECERKSRSRQRKRRYSFKKSDTRNHNSRSLSSSSSTSSQSDRSCSRRRNRSRSRSPYRRGSRSRSRSKSRSSHSNFNNNKSSYVDRNVSQPAVEERRIVYVGRIEEETTKDILRRKFLAYGKVKQVSVHYKENGMKYGFVTFERSQDAFDAIDNCNRDPQISMYDVSFGGRRAFCRASYSDLDNAGINTYESYVFPKNPVPQPKEDDSFEALLQKMKAKLNANKTKTANSAGESSTTVAPANTNSK